MTSAISPSLLARAAGQQRFALWWTGLAASGAWAAAALVTQAMPDVVRWGSTPLFAGLTLAVAILLALASLIVPRAPGRSRTLRHYGPWLLALGIWLAVWELATAKLGWLPKPFFSPPQGLLNVYVVDWQRLALCVGYTLRLWALGFVAGVAVGYGLGVALGWSRAVSYWGMPILKLIGPVPATAWIPCTFFFFPTTFAASVFIVALAAGIPVAILTASGVSSVETRFYDVSRVLGAGPWYLITRVAVPAALPHTFVGLFMGLYTSFAVMVVAEMLGAKYGLGWYIQFQTSYSAYANVYAALLIMALLCSGIVRLLFAGRDRLLGWQKGFL